MPNFNDPVAAARAWADAQEAARLAQNTAAAAIAERDHAIRTKAEIGSRREATSMATASIAVKKVNRLEDELGKGMNFKSVVGIPWYRQYFKERKGVYGSVGWNLKKISSELGIDPIKIEDSRYGKVNSYHVTVITEFKRRLDSDPSYLAELRI